MTPLVQSSDSTDQRVRRRIMVVDDDPDYVEALRMQLDACGYEVVTADGAADARRRFEEVHPDAAIIDLMMEEQDGGFSLCHFMKRKAPRVPVIIVSAVTSETGMDFIPTSAADRAWIKADAMLAKPIRFEQLQRELHRLVPAEGRS